MEDNLKYLQLLSRNFPTVQSACTEIINLEAILNLPKGTEHFVTDLHGESEAFQNVLRNASGVVRQKADKVFGNARTGAEERELCALIYYPEEKLEAVEKDGRNMDEWYRVTLMRLIRVLARISAKYTRSKVRKALPKDYSYIIEELLQESLGDFTSKQEYLKAIVNSIIETDRADHFVKHICNVARRLVIDHLHIIGDIYDRGAGAHCIMDTLCGLRDYDIQWGNHDLSWMGAAAGGAASMANVLRLCLRYATMATLEDGYGINLLPLATFAMRVYQNDPCSVFMPDKEASADMNDGQKLLTAQMHKAITVIQFKLEHQIIERHPEWGMEDRNLLHLVDFSRGVITIDGTEYPMRDCSFPTVDPSDSYSLTSEEKDVVERLVHSFTNSETLARHMGCMYSKGALYLVRNSNLLYHGSVPLNEDGSFAELDIMGEKLHGKELFDRIDGLVRTAYYGKKGSDEKLYGQDLVWYLWCGPVSPPFDKDRMTTFERYFIEDKATHKEKKGNYYTLKNNPAVCDRILREFGIEDTEHGHIINGHIPVQVAKGESPIKAGGKLLVIDGGFSKAYRRQTGIAGYTLLFNSHGLKLVQHEPFESRHETVEHGMDVMSEIPVVVFPERLLVRDTDKGRDIAARIEDLKKLLVAYRSGQIRC
ncbi:MAG: fructose-1,6-bisphosphatase [Bacteroidaceae bacterium]|nr:fructose-1,6-bisphosphatase [Bacteroidaceae bacterium]